MDATTLVVGTQYYRFESDVDELKRTIVAAVRDGGSFVTVTSSNGRRTDLLITSCTDARIEFTPQDGAESDSAGASGAESFLVEEYDDDYGL
jgi:hypothetical protein